MMDKFAQFDEYQLAKYNPRKHRAKSCVRRSPRPPVSPCLNPDRSQPRSLFSGKGGTKEHADAGVSHTKHLACVYYQEKKESEKNAKELYRAQGAERAGLPLSCLASFLLEMGLWGSRNGSLQGQPPFPF